MAGAGWGEHLEEIPRQSGTHKGWIPTGDRGSCACEPTVLRCRAHFMAEPTAALLLDGGE